MSATKNCIYQFIDLQTLKRFSGGKCLPSDINKIKFSELLLQIYTHRLARCFTGGIANFHNRSVYFLIKNQEKHSDNLLL